MATNEHEYAKVSSTLGVHVAVTGFTLSEFSELRLFTVLRSPQCCLMVSVPPATDESEALTLRTYGDARPDTRIGKGSTSWPRKDAASIC